MPRSATFLARAGMRMVMARLLASLKSAISLAPLRSSPGPSMLDVTSITIGRRSRTLPPRQSSTSPAANLARSASSKPAASVSLLWARAGAAAAVAVADAAARNLRRVVRMATVSAPAAARRVIELWLADEPAGNKPADGSFPSVWPVSQVPGLDGRHSGGLGRRRDRDRVFLCHVGRFPRPIESHASALSGRKTTIADISVDWGFTSHVHLSGVQFANAEWAKEPHMLKAEQVDFEIRLWPLLKGDLVLPSLVLRKPEIVIEKGDNDRLNWELGEAPAAAAAAKEAVEPDNRFETPLIGRLEVTEGKLSYRDPKRKLDLDGTVSTATGQAGEQPQAELQLKGKLEGQPLTLRFVGGSIVMLRDTEQPYPLDLDVTFGATKLKAKGTVMDPFQWTGADVELSLSGHDLADIYPLLGIPGRRLRPITLAASCIASPASGNSSRASGMSATAT